MLYYHSIINFECCEKNILQWYSYEILLSYNTYSSDFSIVYESPEMQYPIVKE